MTVKYPNVTVKLIGTNGNAFSILANVIRALRKAKVSSDEIMKFQEEATSGDYNKLLQTAMQWVNVK